MMYTRYEVKNETEKGFVFTVDKNQFYVNFSWEIAYSSWCMSDELLAKQHLHTE